MSAMRILLVDDEDIKRTVLRDDLRDGGYTVETASCAEEGLKQLEAAPFDVVVTDLRMKAMDGIAFIGEIKRRWPAMDIIMVTAYATVDNAVQAMKMGAFDYLTKPFESAKLVLILEKIAAMRALKTENASLKAELAKISRHGDIIGRSDAMRRAFEQLDVAIACDAPVLLFGETGTGKEMFATAIHRQGARQKKPFIRVSCAALSEQLMESELFGHERGSFTGAMESKPGRFELADKGTLFLDDIDDVPLSIQVKLLRVLEGYPYERVGGVTSIQSDVRIVAATKLDLRKRAAEGFFRSDLFFRLNVFPIAIPPLRERREDIPLLAEHFLALFSGRETPPVLTEEASIVLWDYSWPGNVRELQNVMRRVLLGLGDRAEVRSQDLPPELLQASLEPDIPAAQPASFKAVMENNEREIVARALAAAAGNQSRAAANLGMKLSTFRDKLAKYGLLSSG